LRTDGQNFIKRIFRSLAGNQTGTRPPYQL
jgi:hypothetical protein